jgi:oxepin-CoA hydrolase/3-oxo-5,6-dehydrosuberyl-CoA semialdehyde dehydrogenase
LSLLVGPAGELVSLLGVHDVLAFTGSGETGARLRAAPNVIRHSIRMNIEADSLNAAVLGPEVEPRSDMYELFLKDVVRDMTQKAGQKCTAIRRILVPRELSSSVRDDLIELLSGVKVGNPVEEDVRMGPLATADQLAAVRDGVERLGGKLAFGDAQKKFDKGFFISPILLEAPGEAVHEHEVFGPVASLISYEKDPGEIVKRGNGGLVCSIYAEDPAFIEALVMEVAPLHGRVFLGHPKIELSPGPGTVLPQLVHGGPGRAGGGEELGGPRGLAFYLQRVALEGSRPVIQKLIG